MRSIISLKHRANTKSIKRIISVVLLAALLFSLDINVSAAGSASFLSDPFLQNPGNTYVRVVWFTEGKANDNKVLLFENGVDQPATREFKASAIKLSTLRGGSSKDTSNDASISREIYRYEAIVDDLPLYTGQPGEKIPYCVMSDGNMSNAYYLQAKAQPGTGMKILLTSDLQLKEMCAANYQKVYETIGLVDAVLVNGDLVDVADSAYNWFDSDNSFFKVMQGKASHDTNGTVYSGGPLIQYAPLYASIGNHEVMGRFSDTGSLQDHFNDPMTKDYANGKLLALSSIMSDGDKEKYIENNSFNTTAWEEILSLPRSKSGDERYYTVTIGDVSVIVLEMARIWRGNFVSSKSKYSEEPGATYDNYGFGQHIFEPVTEGSAQLSFLKEALQDSEFQNAKYKMVMYHFDSHSIGSNNIPAYTNPVASSITDPITGLDMTIYDYPIENDYIKNNVEPLLEQAGVDFVFTAHSHIYNRFKTSSGMNILQSSNVGNTYGTYYNNGATRVDSAPSTFRKEDWRYSIRSAWDSKNYIMEGDPLGLTPIQPQIGNTPDGGPYIASNSITEFSIFDTSTGCVTSYVYDTKHPENGVKEFDQFDVKR